MMVYEVIENFHVLCKAMHDAFYLSNAFYLPKILNAHLHLKV